MHLVTLKTAIFLTGLSRRTLWRRIAAGAIAKKNKDEPLGRTQVPLEGLLDDIGIPLNEEDMDLIRRADNGDPMAQGELGLMLLQAGQPERAIHWLEQAATREDPDAMHWLGRCHVAGEGVEVDETLGLSWITRAAARGHVISRRQVEVLGGEVG
ncbi:tetratricopeptide repeat protein [Ectothiorhodospira sp. BSL-9]|uniref:tetratricopeptide repeat protein n=1 Tax=Ectothiorhodospira sp. BSL-9 TaxID=1442136 RepID=UPI0007B430BC|nr:SEL1-like repeat protein [Ectothiorhodospira sp. BSL-9]ANB01446.1 hypothetical protein ECTOBSL9_0557 [Ectothiorhodospira sp. BSL-9]